MKKEEAIRIITNCAKLYHNNLENKNLLFVFISSHKLMEFEASFSARQFLHLTGVELNTVQINGSSDFYKKCLRGQLSPHDFEFAKNGTSELKLSVLPQLMNIHRSAKMVGDYDFTKSVLYTEKLAGGVSACLGFVKSKDNTYYIPNTAIREDIRDITKAPQMRVLYIFRKSICAVLYSEVCYTARGYNLSQLIKWNDIIWKIDSTILPTNQNDEMISCDNM